MSSQPPPGSGEQPPEDDPFRKRPPADRPDQGTGSPYDAPQPPPPPPPGGDRAPSWSDRQPPPHDGGQPPPGGGSPYGGSPYGGAPGGGSPYGGSPYGGPGGGPHGGGPGRPGDPLAGMPPLADSGRRVLARVIDLILVGIVVWLVTWAFGVHEYDVSAERVDTGRSLWQSVVAAVLYVAYDTFMIARTGQTLGKKWLKMRVANLGDGANPSMQNSLLRALVLWLPFAFCCACVWTAICGGWSFFDKPYKQGLHDKAAKTVEVSTR
ncbi:RDD family protein [Streptomyces sp. J2-1]|uniref:RDD family protein n=1 Tax=Streptomyces corallincola TaxID=2851888 RepID=UPI001C384BB6|nr:RDD family protein [Streptomyces corallincola]MBV2354389.1 RDD family protein [Streptomyces corallincola]